MKFRSILLLLSLFIFAGFSYGQGQPSYAIIPSIKPSVLPVDSDVVITACASNEGTASTIPILSGNIINFNFDVNLLAVTGVSTASVIDPATGAAGTISASDFTVTQGPGNVNKVFINYIPMITKTFGARTQVCVNVSAHTAAVPTTSSVRFYGQLTTITGNVPYVTISVTDAAPVHAGTIGQLAVYGTDSTIKGSPITMSGSTLTAPIMASVGTNPDGTLAQTSRYGDGISITIDHPAFATSPTPGGVQMTIVGANASAAESESTVAGFGASALNNSYVDICGVDVDCIFGGPPSIFGAYASGVGTSLGYKAFTGSKEASAIGPKSEADADASFAWGDGAKAFHSNDTVIGDAVYARNNVNIVMGGGGGVEHDAVLCLYCFGSTTTYAEDLTTASNQALLGRVPDGSPFGLLHWFFGMGVKNTGTSNIDFNIAGAKGVNANGADWLINGSTATGTGTPGSLIFATSLKTVSGSGDQSLVNRVKVDDSLHLINGTNALFDSSTVRATALSPTVLSADVDNYNPGASNMVIRLSSSATHNVTGLVFTNTQIDGEIHLLINQGSNPIVLVDESTNSTAGNRFHNSVGNVTLNADESADVIYDGTLQRWRIYKRN